MIGSHFISFMYQVDAAKESEAKPKGPQPGTREYAAEDLRKLISTGEPDDIKVEEDLPPLLQVYETIS